MSKLITRIKRLALALCLATPFVSRAADAPTITVDGTTVTINNETASTYATWSLGVNDTWQSKGFWLPNGTGLDAGKVVKVTSIAFAVPSDKVFCDKIGIAGCVSASAVRTEGGFTTAEADKVLFSFEGSECFLRAGSSSRVWFLDSNGAKIASTIWFRTGASAYQHIDNLVWSGSAPVVEIVGEIMAGSSITGSQNAIGNSGTDPLYAFDVTGYLDTSGSKTGPVVLVENNSGAYSIGVNNANSVNAAGQHSTWSKLSGSGTLGTVANDKGGTYPVLEIYDSSEFTGTITVGGVSGAPNLSVVFCTAEESDTLKTSYNNWFRNSYLTSLYVSEASVVTVPAGKTWQASKLVVEGEATINGTFNGAVVNNGSLTINGTVTGAISNTGKLVVEAGATISGFGSTRDFDGVYVDSSIPVKITMTAEEYGKGSVSVTGADGISSITVLAPDGTTEVGSITPEEGAGTLETDVKVSGKACWYAWEMNGNLNGSGANTAGLSHDTGSSDQNAFYNSSMLYTYRHPYTTVAFPANWTAVVRCTVPKVVNGTVITFGTKFTSFIGLIAGDDPETEMKLVRYNNGDEAYTVLASMPILDGTSAQHVYIFSVENNSAVKVYCDGSLVLDDTFDTFSLGNGIQIGSAHGGVAGGLVRMWAGDTYAGLTTEDLEEARIDCVRLYNYSLSDAQVAALSAEFPAVKLYRATAAADANTTWNTLTWAPAWDGGNNQSKVILTTEGDATIALPETITADQLQLSLAADSTLTLAGPGSLTVTEPVDIAGGTLELTGTVTLTQNATFNGAVNFTEFTKAGDGAIQLANGATVGVDAALVVTPLGTYTCAEGTVVDSAYTGDGVKLIPYADAVVSIKQGTTTLYYSDLDTALAPLINTPGTISEDVEVTLLNGTVLPFGYDTFLQQAGYYIDGNVITRAVARIGTPTYPSLAAAVTAAADGATVTLLLASSEAITLSDKAITLSETANFSGTLTGNGTLTFAAFRNNPSITFTDWTGTVVLPEFAANGTILNKYGVTGSTVVLKGITGGWLGETGTQTMDAYPVLQLDGDVTIKGFSTSWTYTFAEITGERDFSLDPTDNSPKAVTISKVAKGFTGAINNGTTATLTIGTLAREEGTGTEVGDKLLDTTGDVVAVALTVGGEPVDVRLVTEEDGIYVGAPVVAVIGETPYTSLADAVAAATDGDTVELVTDVTLTARVEPTKSMTIDLGGFTITREGTGGNGSVFDVKGGTVTIKNGEIDCTQDDAAIVADGVYAITARSGSAVTLEGLTITVDSQAGACVYPFSGATVTINSGTYKNETAEEYQYKTGWTGMAVNQANVTDKLITITGGSFWQVNPEEGDDSGKVTNFLADGYIAKLTEGYWVVSSGTWVAEVAGTKYETLAAAVADVLAEGTVTLLADVTLTARVEPSKSMTIDLGGFTITREGTSGNGSVFDVKSGTVTIKNGTIDCTQDDTAIVADGVYAITARSGSAVTLEGLTITVDSQAGACVYPFAGAEVSIVSGTYANITAADYQYHAGWRGMAVNQANVAQQLITIYGGSFKQVDPTLGDDSWASAGNGFLADGYASTWNSSTGYYDVAEKKGIDPTDPESKQEITPTPFEIAEAGSAEEAAIAKAEVTVPEAVTAAGVDAATYKSYFELQAVETSEGSGVYTVTVTDLKEEVKESVSQDAVEELVAAIEDTEATTVTVAVPAGLYYKVETFDTLGGTAVDSETGLSTGATTAVDKPTGTTQGFIRVTVGAAPIL